MTTMQSVWFDKSLSRVLLTLASKKLWSGAVFSFFAPTRGGAIAAVDLPGDRWVRVQNRLSGVCGTDLRLVYVDVDPKVHVAALGGSDRIYLGHELVGEVLEVGSGVTRVQPGDRVTLQTQVTCASQELPKCRHCAVGNYSLCENQAEHHGPLAIGGGWSEQMVCHESQLFCLPPEVCDDRAVFIEPLACSVRAALRRVPAAGQKVLVVGCGMIGLGLIQALRIIAPDAEIFASARHPQQRDAARRFGAQTLEHEDLFEAAAALTKARPYHGELGNRTLLGGFDLVLDCVGNEQTVNQALRCCRGGGAVVVVGIDMYRPRIDLTSVWHQEVDLVGSMAHGAESWQGEQLSTYELVVRWLLQEKLDVEGLATHRFGLSQWKKAVKTAANKRSGAIKVLLDLS